ncbi:MAG: hypothetical protein ACC645_04660 [Pirellulales bacterium]
MISSRQPGWIGVDIGTHAVKLAQVERRNGSLRLVEALVVRRREAWPADTMELSPTASSEEVSAGLSLGGGFRGRKAAVVLPMAVCDARGCTIADRGDIDPRELVVQELDAAYGNAAELREFDFWPVHLPDDEEPPSENTIAFSVPRAWTCRVAEDLVDSRLVGQMLDALPLALARAVELGSPGASRSPVAAVDWGCGRATLCAVFGGRPLFVRCLRNAGFEGVLQSLRATLSVNQDEAQKLLTDHGLPHREQETSDELPSVIEEVIAEPLNRFVEELNRTLAFVRQQRRSLAPKKLILFGGGASIRNVSQYLVEKVGLPVEPWDLETKDAAGDLGRVLPMQLLGPAIALSSVAWSKV